MNPIRYSSMDIRTSAVGASRRFHFSGRSISVLEMLTEFQTGAKSNYNGLQTAYTQQWNGLTLRANYTFSHCLDEVSNGGLLAFSTQGLESPLPGELSRQYASCDYDVRHNISAFGMYQVPFHSDNALLRQIFGGWSFSETAFLHSGLPFSVLSQPIARTAMAFFKHPILRKPSSLPSRTMPTECRECRSIARLPIPALP